MKKPDLSTPKARVIAVEASLVNQKFQDKKARETGLTQEVISSELGITQGVVGQWLNGITRIPDKRLIWLASRLGFNAYAIREDLADYNISDHNPPQRIAPTRIPIVGNAQAGPDGYWDDMGHLEHSDEFVEIPCADPKAYALRVRGDSMSPAIRNGWVIVVEPDGQLSPGEFAVVCTTDGLCMVKEFMYQRGDEYTFISINQDHKPITVSQANITRLAPIINLMPPSQVKT